MLNKFFGKRDAINITPFLDIMLVLFVVIIVVASFDDKNFEKENKNLLLKIDKLEKQLNLLHKKNNLLKSKNKILLKQISQNKFFINASKEVMSECVVDVNVMDNYLEVGNKKYSLDDFMELAKTGLIRHTSFRIKRTESAEKFYKKLKTELKSIGFTFKR